MDSDTMDRPGSHARVLDAFRDGRIHILLGTQMIAKGLDFPNVMLVGVINADVGLHLPDFRATERTFQLLSQVAGRAGRGPRGGRVLIQTYTPEHPCITLAASHDYERFAEREMVQRRLHGYPPYQRLVRLIVRSLNQEAAATFAERLAGAFRPALANEARRAGSVNLASRERERPEEEKTPVAHAPGSPQPVAPGPRVDADGAPLPPGAGMPPGPISEHAQFGAYAIRGASSVSLQDDYSISSAPRTHRSHEPLQRTIAAPSPGSLPYLYCTIHPGGVHWTKVQYRPRATAGVARLPTLLTGARLSFMLVPCSAL
jgi:hypothetical protein